MRLFPFAAYIIIQLFTFVEVNIRIYRYMKLLLKFSGSWFFLIGIKGIHAVILPSRKEFNVDPPNIHTTWQWTHLRKRLRMCEFVCWWRKCRMCKNRIVEEQKHWRILHENDTKRRINWLLRDPISQIYFLNYINNEFTCNMLTSSSIRSYL